MFKKIIIVVFAFGLISLPLVAGGDDIISVEESKSEIAEKPWKFIKKKLLLIPGYPAKFSFILSSLSGYIGRVTFNKIRNGKDNERYAFLLGLIDTSVGSAIGFGVSWSYESLLYASNLYLFFKKWEKYSEKVPLEAYNFLEKEHNRFVQGPLEYIIWNTRRVLGVISGAVKCHESSIGLEGRFPSFDGEEE